ncbi:MAG: DUF4430 domain-containing protein, partial [Bacillota bacterium]|nr:DUF4430 domain-containing protein [Bacillota bacterium]
MKKSRLLVFALVAVMAVFAMAPVCGAFAADESTTLTVSVQIEGPKEHIVYAPEYEVTINKAADQVTVGDVMRAFDADNEGITMEITETGYGAYISAINNMGERAMSVYPGWQLAVNNEGLDTSMDNAKIKDGDELLCVYAAMGMTNPSGYYVYRDADGKYTLGLVAYGQVNIDKGDYGYYEAPLTGTTVYLDGKVLDGVTNEEGEIAIPANLATGGEHIIQVERYAEGAVINDDIDAIPANTPVPNVSRLSPDTYIEISNFADVPAGNWAETNIYNLVNLGVINGITLTTFEPK